MHFLRWKNAPTSLKHSVLMRKAGFLRDRISPKKAPRCRIAVMAISRYRPDKPEYRSDYYCLGEATDADADATMTVRASLNVPANAAG